MDIEQRDISYILPAYLRSYLFYTKNEMPERIIFPMFPSIKFGDIDVPIDYLPPIDPVVIEITQDGSGIPEVTEQQEAEIDTKDEEIKRLKAELAATKQTERGGEVVGGTAETRLGGSALSDNILGGTVSTEQKATAKLPAVKSKARTAFATPATASPVLPNRKPKLPPGGDIGPGAPLSDMHPRDVRAEKRMKRDLLEEPDIDESAEKEFGKDIARDEQGRPVVKED